ncbi:MAG: DUF2478 domain-containing protein [Candidatus Aminicenantes bacterium]|nr:DUF2478 domain-containing protein [Candidatus Aminicenantes bacterium]
MIDILTGPVRSGKTTLLLRLWRELSEGGIQVGGFLSLSTPESGELFGYDLLDLAKDRTFPFIRKRGKIGWERIGPFFFIPDTLEKARNLIFKDVSSDICIVDEVGPLELEGKGLWPALSRVLFRSAPRLLLTVRTNTLEPLGKKLGDAIEEIFSITDADVYSRMVSHFMNHSG